MHYSIKKKIIKEILKGVINIELICKSRGCGKTYDLIMESARTGIPILTPYNPRYIADQVRWMGVKIPHPMSVQEYKYFKNNGSLLNSKDWKGKLLIDEVDGVLEQLLGTHVVIATCTPDSMNKKENNNMDLYLSKEQIEEYEKLIGVYCVNKEEITNIDIENLVSLERYKTSAPIIVEELPFEK